MRKLWYLLPILFFIVLQQHTVLAQTLTPQPSPTPVTQVQYTLPYPGLLPDNPLYFLKVFRDRLVSFFISDPLKKSEFNLMQADKRLNSAYYLNKEGGKDDLTISTLSKGENYFEQAVGDVKNAKSQGEDIGAQLGKMEDSSKEHLWVIQQMEKNAPSVTRAALEKQAKRVEDFAKQVGEIAAQ